MDNILKLAINIPSGKLICGNDFRDLYREDRDDVDFDVNERMGVKHTTEEYARRGLFHGFVGNSCPGIYLSVDGKTLSIANMAYNEETNDYVDDGSLGDPVGGICTDLWWYSVADFDDFKARGGEVDERWDTIVDVEPGRYVLSHDLNLPSNDWKSKQVYCTIERSDEEIIPWKYPEEGAVEAIFALLPEKFSSTKTVDVPPPEDADEDYIENYWKGRYDTHTFCSRLFVRRAWERPPKADYNTPWKHIGYEVWGFLYDGEGDKDHLVEVVASTAEELQDYEAMAARVIESFEANKTRDRIYQKRQEDRTPEELEFMKEQTKALLKRMKAKYGEDVLDD